jgi:hypothetical protein
MTVKAFKNESLDLTEDVLDTIKERSQGSETLGQVLLSRTYTLSDPDGKYNPEISGSYFNLNPFRGRDITERNTEGIITFKGQMDKIWSEQRANGSIVTIIQASESLRILLDYIVDDTAEDSTFRVNGAVPKGNDRVNVDTGTLDLDARVPILVNFTNSVIPRYQINEANPSGSATKTIFLDRPLEKALANNDVVYLNEPVEKTIPEAMKDVLELLIPSDRILTGFDTYHTVEAAANRKIWLNVRPENEIKLRNHLQTLLDLFAGLYIIVTYQTGQIDLVKIPYDGTGMVYNITEDEIVKATKAEPNNSRLLAGYDFLYRDGDEVNLESGTVSDAILLEEWNLEDQQKARILQPIRGESINASAYPYLYNSSTTAAYYGSAALDYYELPKKIVKAGVKKTLSNDLTINLPLQRGSRNLLTFSQGETLYTDEPTIVRSSTYNENTSLWQVEFELNNNPVPGI